MKKRILTRRRNRDTLFVFRTCYLICLGPGSLLFIFVSIGAFVVEISLVNERVSSIHKNPKIPEMVVPWHRFSGPSRCSVPLTC